MFTYDMIAEDIQAGKEALKLVHTLQEELAKLKKSVQILTSDLDEEVSDDDDDLVKYRGIFPCYI